MSGPIHCKVLVVGDLDGDGKLAGVVLTMAREDVRRFGAHLYADIVIDIDEDVPEGADVGGHRAAVADAVTAEQDARRVVDPDGRVTKDSFDPIDPPVTKTRRGGNRCTSKIPKCESRANGGDCHCEVAPKREQRRGEPIAKAGTDVADLVRQAVALLAFDKTAILTGGTIRDSLEVPPWRWSRVLEELRHHANVRRNGVGPGVRYQWREADQ